MVPFPSPLHSNLDYVYTINQDAGAFIISLWDALDGSLMPKAVSVDLARLYEASDPPIIKRPLQLPKSLLGDNIVEVN